jgi:hypothetical protein
MGKELGEGLRSDLAHPAAWRPVADAGVEQVDGVGGGWRRPSAPQPSRMLHPCPLIGLEGLPGRWQRLRAMALSKESTERAVASPMASSQEARWYSTGELGVGNFRRQCLPGFSKPLPRQRARVRSLRPKCSRASRAVAQSWRCWLSIALVQVAPWNGVGGEVHPTSWLEECTTGYPDQLTRPDRAGRL